MYHSIKETQNAIVKGEVSVVKIVQAYLDRITETQDLNIYIEVWGDEAIQRAQVLDAEYKLNPDEIGPLHGVVMSIKDVLCYKDHIVTAGSNILKKFESQLTATAVQRAIDAGAIIIGRTNCDEFAMGSTNEHSTYGATLNGLDRDHVPGGSSGGAAVSVQMKTCLIALGSDTGGSVRQPAAYCGVYGFKPTYGRISRYGLIAYGSSFDQIGILANEVEDISCVFSVIEGKDDLDATSSDQVITKHKDREPPKEYKIAYFPEVMHHPGLSESMKTACQDKMDELLKMGHLLEPVSFDLLDYLVPAYYVLTTAEASSNLSRYDGVRYGHRTDAVDDIESLYVNSRSEGFGIEVKRRIMMGTFVLSVGYFDDYFTKAQKVRQLISSRINDILATYDFIIMPTITDTAPKLGDATKDPVEMYLSDVFTVLANLCGLPAISFPVKIEGSHLSGGVQLMAAAHDESRLLALTNKI